MAHMLLQHRLRWLGHLACMDPSRMPKQLLFGEFEKKRPSHGTKRRWRDVAAADVGAVVDDGSWYELAQDRGVCKSLCRDGVSSLVEQHYSGWSTGVRMNSNTTLRSFCCPCGRSFRRQGDRTRHQQFCAFTMEA